MMKTFYYDIMKDQFCDAGGSVISLVPALAFLEQPIWEICVLADGAAVDLSSIVSARACVAEDFDSGTPPMTRTLNAGIDLTDVATGKVRINLDANTQAFLDVVNGKSETTAYFELLGFTSSGLMELRVCFQISAQMLLDPALGDEIPDPATLYADKAYVDALAKLPDVYQYSETGTDSGHDTRTSADKYYRQRKNIEGSSWSAWLDLPRSELIIDTKTYSFSTTAESANPLVISKETLGIASDAEPQVSVWLINGDGSKQLAGDSVIPVKAYTADGTSLSLTYYQTAWPVANWQIKMS